MKRSKPKLDYDRISRILGTTRKGKVHSRSGYFGALALAAEIEERFRTPTSGGRATDPRWTRKRLLPMTPETLERLERVAEQMGAERHVRMHPMQVAAILVEKGVSELSDGDLEALV